ncbi:MAG: hypothetical protein NTU86_03705 [Burkholderiales bacterium]|nr:hypothetical protein [Burkholderiales bacterium]
MFIALTLPGCATKVPADAPPAGVHAQPPMAAAAPPGIASAPPPSAASAVSKNGHAELPRAVGVAGEAASGGGRHIEGTFNGGTRDSLARLAVTRRTQASTEATVRTHRTIKLAEAEMAPPALSADQERTQRRDEYIARLAQGSYAFNPPTTIKVARPISVALWVDPVAKAAELAQEMGKTFPASAGRIEADATAWSPRMKATLTGVDFAITPVGDKDFDGVKDLSANARTEWGWTLVPTAPGKKQLHLVLAVVLPPELGLPRELPQIERNVEVEVTIWWVIDHYWERYWQWMLGGLASALAASLAWWWKNRQSNASL